LKTLHLIERGFTPIYEQLILEEQLLRADTRNICLINYGSTPAIVMGISGKKENAPLPLIKRFSGGGTVVVDENTIFITFIFNKIDVDIPAEPKAIMQWTETLYSQVFPLFKLRDNDYVFGDRKFGGNAQYIKKDRWLHHTSFLWDYDPARMEMLSMPEKMPAYRQGRGHLDFITPLKEHFTHKEAIGESLKKVLHQYFKVLPYKEIPLPPSRQSTTFI